jgi:chromate transport protein ChrA
MTGAIRRNWLIGLTAITALLYIYVGIGAHGLTRLLALAGGVLILAAAAVAARSRPLAWMLLLAGALPVAVATWWSIVTPLLAVLALLFGWLVTRRPPTWRRTTKDADSRL